MTIEAKPASKWELSRRSLLKHLGLGLGCLPLLHATRSYAATPAFPTRLLIVASTEGYVMPKWLPGAGTLGSLPESLTPLDAYKNDIIVLGDMGNPTYSGTGHQAYGTIYCSGPSKEGASNYNEPTVATFDQVIAAGFAKQGASPRKSLHLATQLQRSKMKGGYPPGGYRCFWEGAGKPITPAEDPYKVFGELFMGAKAPSSGPEDVAAMKLLAENTSILQYVGRDLERFKARLGTEDRQAIEQHLGSIRNLEKNLAMPRQSIDSCSGKAFTVDPMNTGEWWNANANYPLVMELQMELMVAAVKCGITRVATLQLASGTGNDIVFDFVPGVPAKGAGYRTYRDWHDLGHLPTSGGINHKQLVDKWCMGQFAKLLKMMKDIPEAGGTMLDNSLALWGNHQQDGANHDAHKIPWVLGGKAGGYLKTGQCKTGGTIGNAMAELCNALGVPGDYHGHAPMSGLKA
jgi:hypothetical protein